MEQIELTAQVRELKGKQRVKQLRRDEWIPAVMCRRGEENILLQLYKKDLMRILHTSLGGNIVVALKINPGHQSTTKKLRLKEIKTVIIKEIQRDPLRNEILHVDFQQISLTEKITVNVPISITGESVGVKRDGGLLEHVLWEVQIECFPTDIPEKIEVDISHLEIGQSIYVKDFKLPEGVKILNDPEQIILMVVPPAKEEVVEAKPEEVVEPEVIKEKKVEAVEVEKEKKQEEKK